MFIASLIVFVIGDLIVHYHLGKIIYIIFKYKFNKQKINY
jgi:hypothetical protein